MVSKAAIVPSCTLDAMQCLQCLALLQLCVLCHAVRAMLLQVVATQRGFEEVRVMNVTLSCDHRVVDGAVGAEWLKAFKQYVENPMLMII